MEQEKDEAKMGKDRFDSEKCEQKRNKYESGADRDLVVRSTRREGQLQQTSG